MVPRIVEPSCAVLGQLLDSDLYAYRPRVAMQRRDHRPVISLQCVGDHKGTLKPEISSSLLRYSPRWCSKRSEKLGHRTHDRLRCSESALTRRHTRQQHQPNTSPIGTSASSALCSISRPLSWMSSIDRGEGVFLTASHEFNTQQRRAARNYRAAAKVTHA
jgi:hypothetical protein